MYVDIHIIFASNSVRKVKNTFLKKFPFKVRWKQNKNEKSSGSDISVNVPSMQFSYYFKKFLLKIIYKEENE